MSVYKVDRKVDTVIVEMDIDVAERLVTVLDRIVDNTVHSQYRTGDLATLFNRLIDDADVRWPSNLYEIRSGNISIHNTVETGG